MPDYLLTSQFESIFFLANQRTGYLFRVREKKNPRPRRPKGDPLAILYKVNCTVYQDIEKVACEHPSRHDPKTNQHTYLCLKIGPWKL